MFGFKNFEEWKKGNSSRTPGMQRFIRPGSKPKYNKTEKLAVRNLSRAKSLVIYYESIGDVENQAKQAESMYLWAGILNNSRSKKDINETKR